MAKFYIKLDIDWRDDPKVMDFESRYGKAALVDLIELFCLMGEQFGSIDMNDNGKRLRVEKVLGKKGKTLETFLGRVAECGLISDVGLKIGRVGSDRSLKDGEARRRRRDAAYVASQAAAESRKQGEGGSEGEEP